MVILYDKSENSPKKNLSILLNVILVVFNLNWLFFWVILDFVHNFICLLNMWFISNGTCCTHFILLFLFLFFLILIRSLLIFILIRLNSFICGILIIFYIWILTKFTLVNLTIFIFFKNNTISITIFWFRAHFIYNKFF